MKNVEERWFQVEFLQPAQLLQLGLAFGSPSLSSFSLYLCLTLEWYDPSSVLRRPISQLSSPRGRRCQKVPPCLLHRLNFFLPLVGSGRPDPIPPVAWKTKNPDSGFWSTRLDQSHITTFKYIISNLKFPKQYFS